MRLFFSLILAALTSLAVAQEPLPLELKSGGTLQVVGVQLKGSKVVVRTSSKQEKTLGKDDFVDPKTNWQGAIQAARGQNRWVDAARSARLLASLYPKDAALQRQQGDLMRERDRKMTDAVRRALDKGDGRALEALVKAARTDAEYNSQFMKMLRGTVANSLSGSTANDLSKRTNEYKALSRVFPDAMETKSLGQVVETLRNARANGNVAPTPAAATGGSRLGSTPPNAASVPDQALAPTTPVPAAAAPVAATAQVRGLVESGRYAQAQEQIQLGLASFPGDPVLRDLAAEVGPKYIDWIQSIQGAEGGKAMEAGGVAYRLYVPNSWGPAVRPPVIFAFSGEAEADAMAKELAPLAENSGAFVVTLKTPIEPWEKLQAAQSAVTADIGARLAIDSRRSIALGPPMAAIGLAATSPGVVAGAIAVGTDLSNIHLTPRAPFPAVLLYPKASPSAEADAAKAVPMYRARGIALTSMPYEGGVASVPPLDVLQSAVSSLAQDLTRLPAHPPITQMRKAESFY